MCEDDKDKQNFEPNSVDGEEVDGRELRNVILKERAPGLRGRFRHSDHVLGNRGLRNLHTQFHQFAVYPGCAPSRVVIAHAVTNLPSPIPAKSLPMPADDGFRHDDD